MKVCIRDTRSGSMGNGGKLTILSMPACPRVGERVYMSEDDAKGFEVRSVSWTPYHNAYDVAVRGW